MLKCLLSVLTTIFQIRIDYELGGFSILGVVMHSVALGSMVFLFSCIGVGDIFILDGNMTLLAYLNHNTLKIINKNSLPLLPPGLEYNRWCPNKFLFEI